MTKIIYESRWSHVKEWLLVTVRSNNRHGTKHLTTGHNYFNFFPKSISSDHISESASGVWEDFLVHPLKTTMGTKPSAESG